MSEKRRKAACKKAEKITIINVTAYCLKAKNIQSIIIKISLEMPAFSGLFIA